MSWHQDWQSLSRRVSGFIEAVRLAAPQRSDEKTPGQDQYINQVLVPLGEGIWASVIAFLASFREALPRSAQDIGARYGTQFATTSQAVSVHYRLLGIAMILAATRTELDYILGDREQVAIAAVERAFEHLQRLIVVDDHQTQLWKSAIRDGEVVCERLGATHLLLHRIWAFKASSKGERTDLVLGTTITEPEIEQIQATGSSLALTEWKIARKGNDLQAILKQAVHQLASYAQGSLAGIELRSVRYAVIVSEKRILLPRGEPLDGFRVRFVNIAINPDTPGKKVAADRLSEEPLT